MNISYNWLQSYIKEPLPKPEELAERIIFGAFEVEETQEVGDDTVFDIKVLPDRAHDCLSHEGIAREVAGLLGLTLVEHFYKTHESIQSDITVHLETSTVRRYIARKILNVKVGPSPEWLSKRLEAVGQRSINNVVDATNYVMLSTGQPVHAFDYDKMANGKIFVRPGKQGEALTTLDGKIVALDETTTVIADERHPLALAGIKGGTVAEVDENTTNVVLEVANFDPVAVRKTAKKVGIHNDSSKRFENEITPRLAGIAIRSVTDLITDIAGGQPEDAVDEYPHPAEQRTVAFTAEYISSVLGTDISAKEISAILGRYGYVFEESGSSFELTVPYVRLDIVDKHDMVEEIGRAYGYNSIAPVMPEFAKTPGINADFAKMSAIRADLSGKGYSEVMTYSFRKKGSFEVARGPVGKSALRTNLVDGLKESYELNKQNAALLGLDAVKIFEIGTVFTTEGEQVMVGIADASGVREVRLSDYEASSGSYEFPEATHTVFEPWSEYPYMTRDIAVWVPADVEASELPNLIKELGTNLLQGEPRLFDTFTKDGRTSYGYRMVFQSYERTLTDAEVNEIMDTIYSAVRGKGWETR